MGDLNQIAYLEQWMPACDGPVLEVGSKEYGSTSSFRTLYPNCEYVGVDMAPGEGVDAVVDLVKTTAPLQEGHFALAICCSVLEHVAKPWLFAENLTRLVRPGGKLYMSVPWVWRYHPYPDDYFRFSHRGVMSLFDQFDWTAVLYSTSPEVLFVPVDDSRHGVDDRMSITARTAQGGERKFLPYLMVNMLGTRRAAA